MSTVKSEPLKDGKSAEPARTRISGNRIAGAVCWLLGVWLTYLFLRSLVGDPLGLAGAASGALISQALLTLGERPLWRFLMRRKGGRLVLASIAVTLIDAALNGAGIYPYIGALEGSNVVTMFVDAFQISPTIDKRTALLLAGVLGLIVASLAEYFWELDERS